jgi:hypothetical protein
MTKHLCWGSIVAWGLLCCAISGWAQTFWQNETAAAITDDISAVTYANGTFAAVTAQGNVLNSNDGISWASQVVSAGTALTSIAYGEGSWVVVGSNGSIFVSADLKTWENVNSPTSSKLNAVFFEGSPYPISSVQFFAVGDNGTYLSSADAKTWVTIPSGVSSSLTGISAFYGDVVVSGRDGVVVNNPGGARTIIETGISGGLNAMVFGTTNSDNSARSFLAVGGGGSIIYCPLVISDMVVVPPTDWINAMVPATSANLWAIASGNSSFVAAGDNGTILTSSNGINWTQQFPGSSYQNVSTATLLGAAFSPTLQRFVVVGTGGAILISDAPRSALFNVSTRGTVSSTQNVIGGFVVEGTGLRTVLVRADGPTLGSFGVDNPLPDPVLTVYDGKQNLLFQNSGWSNQTESASVSAAASAAGAFSLPSGSKDSAVLLTLSPGTYTAVITSAGGNSGTVLFEAYVN